MYVNKRIAKCRREFQNKKQIKKEKFECENGVENDAFMYSVVLGPSAFVPHTFSPCFYTLSASFLACFQLLIEADNANKNAVKIPYFSICFFASYAASVYKKKRKPNVKPFRYTSNLFSKELRTTPKLFSMFKLFYGNSTKP